MSPEKKITVVGAGNVGAEVARRTVEKGLGDVVLIDILDGIPQGKGLDIWESAPIENFNNRIFGTNNYADTKDSDIVVITAGLARKPGMTREDLLMKNAEIVGSVVDQAVKVSPNAILLVVSNPLDIMTQLAFKKSGFPKNRVFGMAGILDCARLRSFMALELNCNVADTEAMILGGHGDAMVPLEQFCKGRGKPISELLSKDRVDALMQRARDGGAEIVKYLKTGSAYYAPSSGVVAMLSAVIHNTGEIIPSACYLEGEYGLRDVYVGVPAKLGRGGVTEVVELDITADQRAALHKSAGVVRENVGVLGSRV